MNECKNCKTTQHLVIKVEPVLREQRWVVCLNCNQQGFSDLKVDSAIENWNLKNVEEPNAFEKWWKSEGEEMADYRFANDPRSMARIAWDNGYYKANEDKEWIT